MFSSLLSARSIYDVACESMCALDAEKQLICFEDIYEMDVIFINKTMTKESEQLKSKAFVSVVLQKERF